MSSSFVSGLQQTLKIIFSWCIVIIVLPVLILFYIYKQSVVLLSKILYTGLVIIQGCESYLLIDKIAENDKVRNDHERTVLTNIGFYADIGEGNLDLNELIQKVQKTVIDPDRISKWRLQSRWFRFGGYTFWKPNPDFNILNQVKKVELSPEQDFLDYLNNWMIEPYGSKASPWGVLALSTGSTEYLAVKIHHCLGDGLWLTEVLNELFDSDYHPQVEKLFKNTSKPMGVFSVLGTWIKAPAIVFDVFVRIIRTPDPFPFQISSGNEVEQFTSTQVLNVHDLKSISKKQGVNFMAVLLRIYGAAIGKYLVSKGEVVPEYLCMSTPQPWPGRPKDFIGNHWNFVNAYIPLDSSTSSLEKLYQVHADLSDFYSSNTFIISKYVLCNFFTLVPTWIMEAVIRAGRIRCSLSCFVCSDDCAYNGRRVRSVYALGGFLYPTFGIFSGTVSIKDKLYWTFVGSKDFFKTKENLDLMAKTFIPHEFEKLLTVSNNSEFITLSA